MSPYRAAFGHLDITTINKRKIIMINPDFENLREKLFPEVGPPAYPGVNNQPKLNQQFFARLAKEVFDPIYEKTEEVFCIYSGETGLWESQDNSTMLARVSGLMKRFADETSNTFVNGKRDVGTINNILNFMRADTCCGRENAFARQGEPYIHCGNGMILFPLQQDGRRRPVLKPFDPKYMSRNRTEHLYSEDARCDDFISRLLKPSLSEDDISLLQQYVAQCLLGVNDSQTFLLLIGTAGGGKSTLVNIIEKLIKRKNCTELRLEHMNSRFETQRLLGKTLLTAKDVASNFLNTAGAHKLKALTGKDTVTIEHKGSNVATDICCAFNTIITANNTLRISVDGDAEAWRRRIILISYNNPPPKEKIPNFDDVLLAKEGDGILRWAVEGAVLLLENGGKIIKSDIQEHKVDNLLHESDALSEFIATSLEPDPQGTVTSAELLEAFRKFCEKRKWIVLPQRFIENRLPEYIYQAFGLSKRTDVKRHGRNNRGYYGLKLIA